MPIFLTQSQSDAIPTLLATLEANRAAARDYIYPAKSMSYQDGRLVLESKNAFRVGDRVYTEWADAEKAADESDKPVEFESNATAPLKTNKTAFAQLRNAMSIPAKYVDTLREAGQHDLLDHNVAQRLAGVGKRFLIRTLPDASGEQYVRAFLSDHYKMLDNADLFFAAATAMTETDDAGKQRAHLWKARLEEDTFEMFAVSPTVQGLVRKDRPDGRHISHHIDKRPTGDDDKGDAFYASVYLRNSETGRGGMSVQFSTFCSACTNFCIYDRAISRIHLGGTIENDGIIYSDETRKVESQATWLKIQDAVRTAFDPEKFQGLIDRLNEATQIVVVKPEAAVNHLVRQYELPEARRQDILSAMLSSNDFSGYGLVQAVTAVGRDVQSADSGTAAQLERLGGTLIGDMTSLNGIAVAC